MLAVPFPSPLSLKIVDTEGSFQIYYRDHKTFTPLEAKIAECFREG